LIVYLHYGYFCISPQKGIFQIRKTLFLQKYLTRMARDIISIPYLLDYIDSLPLRIPVKESTDSEK